MKSYIVVWIDGEDCHQIVSTYDEVAIKLAELEHEDIDYTIYELGEKIDKTALPIQDKENVDRIENYIANREW